MNPNSIQAAPNKGRRQFAPRAFPARPLIETLESRQLLSDSPLTPWGTWTISDPVQPPIIVPPPPPTPSEPPTPPEPPTGSDLEVVDPPPSPIHVAEEPGPPLSQALPTDALPIAPQTTRIRLQKWGPATRSHPPTFTATILHPNGSPIGGLQPSIESKGELQAAYATLTIKDSRLGRPVTHDSGSVLTTYVSQILPPSQVPTGIVHFYADGKPMGRAKLDPWGIATFRPKRLPLGLHSITAQYVGDDQFLGAQSATVPVNVTLTRTSTWLTLSSTSIAPGQSIKLTSTTMTDVRDIVAPTGHVRIYAGRRLLARIKLGTEKDLATLDLPPGLHTLRSVYEGDHYCRPSRSTPIKLRVLALNRTSQR